METNWIKIGMLVGNLPPKVLDKLFYTHDLDAIADGYTPDGVKTVIREKWEGLCPRKIPDMEGMLKDLEEEGFFQS